MARKRPRLTGLALALAKDSQVRSAKRSLTIASVQLRLVVRDLNPEQFGEYVIKTNERDRDDDTRLVDRDPERAAARIMEVANAS